MATRGPKPKSNVVRFVSGTAKAPSVRPAARTDGKGAKPPILLTGRVKELWRAFIAPAAWLSAFDGPKAWLWCELQAEAESGVATMTAARIAQLRALGSELGLDPASRTRIGDPKPGGDDPASRFFEGA